MKRKKEVTEIVLESKVNAAFTNLNIAGNEISRFSTAINAATGKVPTLEMLMTQYRVKRGDKVANGEKFFPKAWITEDGFFFTEDFSRYAGPLIQGETKPPMQNGLPRYVRTAKHFIL